MTDADWAFAVFMLILLIAAKYEEHKHYIRQYNRRSKNDGI